MLELGPLPAWTVQESQPPWHGHGSPNDSATQAQIHPNTDSMYEQEHQEGPGLREKSHRVSMAEANSRMSKESWGGSSIASAVEARGLDPDQQLTTMNICM